MPKQSFDNQCRQIFYHQIHRNLYLVLKFNNIIINQKLSCISTWLSNYYSRLKAVRRILRKPIFPQNHDDIFSYIFT